MIEANYQGLTGISQAYLSEQRGKLDNILDRLPAPHDRAAALREDAADARSRRHRRARSPTLERELTEPDLNERARAALQKNLELKRRLLASYAEVGGTMKALATELDSMESLLEVLHQNSIVAARSAGDLRGARHHRAAVGGLRARGARDGGAAARRQRLRGSADRGDAAVRRAGQRCRRCPTPPRAEGEGPVSRPFETLPALGADAGARHSRAARQHLRPARQHARRGAGAAGRRRRRRRGFVPLTRVPRRLDLRPARRGDRVPARQRRRSSTRANRTSTSPTPWRWSTPCTAPTWRDRCRAIRRCSSRCSIRS